MSKAEVMMEVLADIAYVAGEHLSKVNESLVICDHVKTEV